MAEMSHFLDDAHKSCSSRRNKKSPRCCLDTMTVDLNQIPGFEFIQQVSQQQQLFLPVYLLNFCQGSVFILWKIGKISVELPTTTLELGHV